MGSQLEMVLTTTKQDVSKNYSIDVRFGPSCCFELVVDNQTVGIPARIGFGELSEKCIYAE